MSMLNYKYPSKMKRAESFKMYVNGDEVEVIKTNIAYFVTVAYDEDVEIQLKVNTKINNVSIHPLNLQIQAKVEDLSLSFRLDKNIHLYINVDCIEIPIFFYGNNLPERVNISEIDYYFKSGQIYDVGEIVLKDNESLYIEGGAVVVGSIYAKKASNVKIYGQGVLDGSFYKNINHYKKMIVLDECTSCEISDIILIEPTTWMIMLAGCEHININGVKEIGEVMSSDGVDIVGSSHVVIENCIFKNNDDCVVVKSFPAKKEYLGSVWDKDVKNIEVKGCVFINDQGGNGIEIGHELRTDNISHICFEDIDILNVGGCGAALSIHNGDRATVKDIVFKNIRIEHYYCKLIDFRVMKSQFNKDNERGQIENIKCTNIRVIEQIYNPGYTTSTIGGYDEKHIVNGVLFEDFYLNERKVMNADQLDIFTKHVKNITFN